MEQVTGIGGLFFRSRDPGALARWYQDRLGVKTVPEAGETVEVDPERYPNGRFAELRDPEGNGIQLWQPMEPD